MKRTIFINIICLIGVVLSSQLSAQVLISAGTYSQNFDSLATNGTANVWADNSTLPGWYASKQVAPNAITSYRADIGSGNTGSLYSYGSTASLNRALGILVSSTPGNIAFGLCFTNDTSFVQSNIVVSFTGEQWRNANTLAQTLAFSYQVGNDLTNSDGTNALAWNSFSSLDFTTPTIGGTSGSLDGTASTNQTAFTNVELTGVAILPGQELFLRWYLARPSSGSSHGVAIDNLSVSFLATNLVTTNASAFYPQTQTRILRIVTYNVEADITLTNAQSSFTNIVITPGSPLPGLVAPPNDATNFAAGGVLEGIGEEILNGNSQPLDVLILQETTSNPITVTPIVNALNTFYGIAGMYSNSIYQATEAGGSPGSGNGPNAIVFNTKTLQLFASTPVDPPGGTSQLGASKSGMSREVMRYQFAPAGVATNDANLFYIYVSHYKSGSTASDVTARAGEAQIVRSNMMTTLPDSARIIYAGDFNTGDTSEPMYSTLIGAGTNQLIDPINPAGSTSVNWDGSSPLNVKTESATLLHYRDDYQMMTTNVYYGISNGLALAQSSYHAFGNNGTTAYFGNVNSASNTSLTNHLATNGPVFISASQLLVDLTGASDHLPVVADYTIPVPAPVITGFNLAETNLTFNVANCITGGVFTVLTSTNLSLQLTDWTALPVTNIANGGFITFTATNAVNPSTVGQFYLLREK